MPWRRREQRSRTAILAAWDERLAAQRHHIDEMAQTGHGPEPAFLFDGLAALGNLSVPVGAVHPEKDGLVRLSGGKGVAHVALLHQANNASVRSTLRRLSAVEGELLAMRERWRDWPPTWRATRSNGRRFARGRACAGIGFRARTPPGSSRWGRCSRTRVRRTSTGGPDGKPVELAAVQRWIRDQQKPETWDIVQAILGREESVEEPIREAARPMDPPVPGGGAEQVLRGLRVASLDRVVRDLSRTAGRATRASVRAELRANPAVRWIGETIACWTE